MATPIELDDVDLSGRTIIDEAFGVGPGTYTIREDDDAVTYSVEPIYLWKCSGGDGTCSHCESMAGIHDSSPGTSGSIHPNCRCKAVKRFLIQEIGRRQGADCARCNQFFYTSDMKGAYCLDCLEIIKEALRDAGSSSFWMGIVLSGGAIICGAAPGGQGAAVVFGLAGLSAFGMDRAATDAANDPPDESYKEPVELIEVDLDLEPVDEEVSNLRIVEAVKATTKVIANLDSFRNSMEKFTYAAGVFDRKYVSLQAKSVVKYREGIVTSLGEQIKSVRTVGSTLKDTSFDIELKPENTGELQAKLEAEGFDEQQLNVLQKLGLDTDAITKLKGKIINTDSSKFTGKLSDLLNTFVTEIETFKNNIMSIGH
jgi:hypothetical protein